MDEVDRSILAVLEKHGRISNAELAARVGLSPSPCLRRVRRLEETGVIRGYRALIDPAAVGRSLRVFAGVRLMRHTRADVVAFERAVVRLPEVVPATTSPATSTTCSRSRSPTCPPTRTSTPTGWQACPAWPR
jgi:Lrp/AsnC family leucine-responsive transcriptional regulator